MQTRSAAKAKKVIQTDLGDIAATLVTWTDKPVTSAPAAAAQTTPKPPSQPQPDATPKTPSTDNSGIIFYVVTKFTKGRDECKVVIRPMHSKLAVIFPGKLNSGGKGRVSVGFSTVPPEGVSREFGLFLQRQMKRIVGRWKTLGQGQKWVTTMRSKWKKQARKEWGTKKIRHTRATAEKRGAQQMMDLVGVPPASRAKRALQLESPSMYTAMASPSVYKAKKKGTLCVLLPDFEQLKSDRGAKFYARHQICIYGRQNKSVNKPAAYMSVPKALCETRTREFSLGYEYGANPAWIRFVAEYVQYAVYKHNTFIKMKHLFNPLRKRFINALQDLWEFNGGNKMPIDRFWRIAPSELPVDKEYIEKGYFPPEAMTDPGYGIWCTKPGMHTIYFDGPKGLTEKTSKPTKMQGYYIAKIPAPDKKKEHFAPTPFALWIWVLPFSFIIGHKRKHLKPTHTADYCNFEECPCLRPLYPLKGGEEICFDYGYTNPDSEEVVTVPDPDPSTFLGV